MKFLERKYNVSTVFVFSVLFLLMASCKSSTNSAKGNADLVEKVKPKLPEIDLNNWKVTLPIGKPSEVKPPAILDYAKNDLLKEFMYNDSTDGSLVFYTYPGASTRNSSYSRTELRERMDPKTDRVNWTFEQGGRMKGKLKMDKISKDQNGKYHKVIVMQIHGRLTNEQRDKIGEDDNNAPPILKIYWNNQKIKVHRKVLKDVDVNDHDILFTKAWGNKSYWFDEVVGFEPFELEIIAEGKKLEVILNGKEKMTFDDIHMERWSVFENYFKAGNYLATKDKTSFSKVKYYELEVTH